MEREIQPVPLIVEHEDGSWNLPNPQMMSLVDLARVVRTIIEEKSTAVVMTDGGKPRTFDFEALSEKPAEEVNSMLMIYARVIQNSREVRVIPPLE